MAIPVGLQLFILDAVYLPISWLSVVLSLTMSCSVGILFGFLPARLMPTKALYYE